MHRDILARGLIRVMSDIQCTFLSACTGIFSTLTWLRSSNESSSTSIPITYDFCSVHAQNLYSTWLGRLYCFTRAGVKKRRATLLQAKPLYCCADRTPLLLCRQNPSTAVQTEPLYCCADRTPLLLCRQNPSTAVQTKPLYCCADKTPLLLCRQNPSIALQAKPLYCCAG